jgi:spore coat protein A, manganese oxidase
VRWRNELPGTEFLILGVFDTHLHGTHPGEPRTKTVTHLHGAVAAADSDGHPDAWFTSGFRQRGARWTTETYEYPNEQAACMLWYHDHAIGQTRLNVYAGLAGAYIIRDREEDALALPRGDYEIPLAASRPTARSPTRSHSSRAPPIIRGRGCRSSSGTPTW